LIYSCTLCRKFWKQYGTEIENFLEQNGSLDLITDPLNKSWVGIEAWRLVLEYFLETPHDQKTGVAYFKSAGIPVITYEYAHDVPIFPPQKRLKRDELVKKLFKSLIERRKNEEIKGKIL
jgi:hypothetical protein